MVQIPDDGGLMHENTFNDALAGALAQRRREWRDNPGGVIAQRTGVLPGDNRLWPDLVVTSADAYPVIVEVEWGDPAVADARARLGRRVAGSILPVRSVVAVGAPPEVRRWPRARLERELRADGVELRFAVLSANIYGGEDDQELDDAAVARWPAEGDVAGGVEDLACLCEYATAPPGLVAAVSEMVANRIRHIAGYIRAGTLPEIVREISYGLGQRDVPQGIRLACCIWLTSIRLQNLLAEQSAALRGAGLQCVGALRDAAPLHALTADDVRGQWDRILQVNYGAVFSAARKSLHHHLPKHVISAALLELNDLAQRLAVLRLGNRVDFAGELFPRLLDDREETAAHYTLPETAELLAGLAVARLSPPDWADADAVAQLRLADLACGTGTLLRAVYRHVRRRHESAGGTADGFHRAMLEQGLTGLDINSLAAHMTASGLSSYEITTEYHRSNIATAAVPGGLTGSLELLAAEQLTDVLGQTTSDAAATGEKAAIIAVPHNSQHLVIQNPPYLRARGGRRMFDVTGIEEPERLRSVKRLNKIRHQIRQDGDEIADGQAGLGSDFSALAHRKLRPGGVFATVLPLTAAHAESWAGFRRAIEGDYRDITVITFTTDESAMLSADTHMNEMLLIATRRDAPKPDAEAASIFCVNMSVAPGSLSEAYWLVRQIAEAARLPGRSGVLALGRRIGVWTRTAPPEPGFPWFTLGMRNHDLAMVIGELLEGRLYSPRDRETWQFGVGFTTLGQLTAIGPTHHLIGHIRGAREAIGAFTFDLISAGEIPTYPALWGAEGERQTRLTVRPTHSGQPVAIEPDQDENLRNMLAQRSDLFISRNLGMPSQALAMARTDAPVMGGSSWTALRTDDEGVKAALVIWGNSTLGLMLRVSYAQTTQPGRARLQINALSGFPAPDFAAATPAGEHARAVALASIGELAGLELQPVSYAFADANRQRLDAVALDLVGLGGNEAAARALDFLRNIWCREPAVHGGNRRVMQQLGLPG